MTTERELNDKARAEVRVLHNSMIAAHLDQLAQNRRAWSKHYANALLFEAGRRLRWDDAYQYGKATRRYGA